jgi:4-carboxymuconolactone decarboxylase
MSRLKLLDYDEMTPEQQKLHDEILSGPRSRIGGPMNGWFRSPELGSLIQKFGAYCRYHTTLEPKLSELAILVVAKNWRQPVEWAAHKPIALDQGLDPAIPDAILAGERPKFSSKEEEAVYDVADEVLTTKKLSEATYKRALDIFGENTLFELTAIISYYLCIALQMNCFAVSVAEGVENAFPDDEG